MARVARTRRGQGRGRPGEGEAGAGTADAVPPAAGAGTRRAPAAPGWMSPEAALAAVAAIGLAHPAMERAADPEGAAQAAQRLGFPVALKVEAHGLVHKTEAGAVRLGLADRDAVREGRVAWQQVGAAGHAPHGFLVQRMAPPGLEMIVGAVRDPRFGPIVSVGLGGIYTEALHDIAVRLAPVTPDEAAEMLASLRSRPLLQGVRGEPPKDEGALRDAVVAVSRLIADDPAVQEVEVNPLRVLERGKGVVAVDARLRMEPPA
jgi:acetate---CoA ligase (ADP-forming)